MWQLSEQYEGQLREMRGRIAADADAEHRCVRAWQCVSVCQCVSACSCAVRRVHPCARVRSGCARIVR